MFAAAIRIFKHGRGGRLPDGAILRSIAIVPMRAGIIACKFGLVIFIGRYLDLAALGLYGLAAGAIAIAPVVVGMGMVHLIMRDAVTLPLDQLTNHLRHYWCFAILAYAAAFAASVVATTVFGASSLVPLIVAIILFEHLGNDVFQLLSNLELAILANVSAFLRGAAWIVVYVPAAIWNPEFRSLGTLLGFWLAGSMAAFALFVWASWSWPWKAGFSLPFRPSWIASTIRQSFLIYLSDLSFIASQYIDRYLVTLFLGLQLAGVYFLYWSVANAVSTFVSISVLQIQRPRLIKAHHNGGVLAHRDLTVSYLKSTTLATGAFSLAAAAAFFLILPLLKQPAVADYLGAFWLIMAGLAARNLADFGAMALFTARRDGIMTLTNVATVLVLIASQILLMPLAGLSGAGAAILITFSAAALWRFFLVFGSQPALRQSNL